MDLLLEKRKLEIEKRLLEIIKHKLRYKLNKKETMKKIISLYQEYMQLDVYYHDSIPKYISNEISNYNCYYYALDIKIPQLFLDCIKVIFNNDMFSNSVGFISKGYDFKYEELTKDSLLTDFFNDLDFLNITKFESSIEEKCENNGYKIAIYIDENQTDYHFLRQNIDGEWSGKWGYFSLPNLEKPNPIIISPGRECFELVKTYEIVKPTIKKLSK